MEAKVLAFVLVLAFLALAFFIGDRVWRYIWVHIRGESQESWDEASRPLLLLFALPLVIVVALIIFGGRA